jgi:sugar lactone lactonase YvrE
MSFARLTADLALDARAMRAEGPLWDTRTERLIWVDVDCGAIHSLDPVTATDQEQDVGQPVGAVGLRAPGGFVLALRDGFALMDQPPPILVAEIDVDRSLNRMNDGKVDPGGRFWAGTMALDLEPGAGALYRLDPSLMAHTMLSSVSISNGIDWSTDGRTMYFIDSLAAGVDAFDYEPETGAIGRRRRLFDVPQSLGLPDGMTVDAEGFLWVALWGGSCVRRYAPSGTLAAVVDLPVRNVTSCAFGGPGLAELYITTARADLSPSELSAEPAAGGIFVCRPGVVGSPANLFLG